MANTDLTSDNLFSIIETPSARINQRTLVPRAGQARNLSINQYVSYQVTQVTASYTAAITDMAILVTTAASTIVVTLPKASVSKGVNYEIKKIDSGAGGVTVTAAGTDLIEGSATFALATQYKSVFLICDGVSNWYKICTT